MNKRSDPTFIPVAKRQIAEVHVNKALMKRTRDEDRHGYMLTAVRMYRPAVQNKIEELERQLEFLRPYATDSEPFEKPTQRQDRQKQTNNCLILPSASLS